MGLPRQLAWAVLTTAFTVAVVPVRADDPTPAPAAIVTNNPTLQKSLDRLFERSAKWRTALENVARLGRRAVVVTPRHIRVKDAKNGKLRGFDEDLLAEVQPFAEHETRVDAVVVVINLDLLERRMWDSSTTLGEFEDDLDRVLAHEIYGHAVPYLLAGDLSGKCADPTPKQRPEDACAIKRENEIRAELKLGKRSDYGLTGLALARRFRN